MPKANLETPAARLKLPVARKPHFVKVVPSRSLGYRRNNSAGAWIERIAIGGGTYAIKVIGHADDFEPSDGTHILDFWQALDKVRAIARASRGAAPVITVATALNLYEADLQRRGKGRGNVSIVRRRLPPDLAKTRDLTARQLRAWRDSLTDVLPATVNRIVTGLRAALNLVANDDETISNTRAWVIGLAQIPDAGRSRNETSIIDDAAIRRLIAAAHDIDASFGLLVEVLAVTGARISQAIRLTVGDLQRDRLMMPTSRKGRGARKASHTPVPISASLAERLRRRDALPGAPLLVMSNGLPWPAWHDRGAKFAPALWKLATEQCGVTATMYALRHSSIVRQLLAGVPIRVVAAAHDTSVAMIERTYSSRIVDHTDAMVRGALLDAGVGR
jgi:integrase